MLLISIDYSFLATLRSAAIPQLRFAQGGNLQTTDEVNPIEATLIRGYPVWKTCDKCDVEAMYPDWVAAAPNLAIIVTLKDVNAWIVHE